MWRWLHVRPNTLGAYLKLAAAMLFAQLLWTYTVPMMVAYELLTIFPFGGFIGGAPFTAQEVQNLLHTPYGILFIMPPLVAMEEVVRLLPILIVLYRTRHWIPERRALALLLIVIATSLLFGFVHIPNGLPFLLVLASQAVSGTFFSVMYLKCGGLHGVHYRGLPAMNMHAKGWLAAWLQHVAFNIVVMFVGLYM